MYKVDFGKVRIVCDGSPFEVAYDVRVEWLVEGEWKLYYGINSLSNDYAMTTAREFAGRAKAKLAAEAAVLPGV